MIFDGFGQALSGVLPDNDKLGLFLRRRGLFLLELQHLQRHRQLDHGRRRHAGRLGDKRHNLHCFAGQPHLNFNVSVCHVSLASEPQAQPVAQV